MEEVLRIHTFRATHSPHLLTPLSTTLTVRESPCLTNQTFKGQIVRIRSRYSKLAFLDLRFHQPDAITPTQNPETTIQQQLCTCCSKITVVVVADNLPSKTCTSYKKGRVKLGDVIQVSGDLVFADPEGGWVDTVPRTGQKMLEARVLARKECVIVDRYVGRGFEAEMPVHELGAREDGGCAGNGTGGEEVVKVCKFWINSGGTRCPLADKCSFRHVPVEQVAEVRKAWLAERKARRLENATLDWGDPTPMTDKAPHALRAAIFADWIIETFGGARVLSAGAGVFDIAGGGGQLCLDLHDRGVTKCTVIDSRPLRVGFGLKKWIKRNRRKHRLQEEAEAVMDEEGEEEEEADVEGHEYERDDESGLGDWKSEREEPEDASIIAQLPFKYEQLYFDLESVTKEICGASILVGLHPDQATGAIVEAALEYNLPFAVIPCCVFKDDFSHRTLKSGKLVATTLDLLEWIKEKRPEGVIQTAFLNFQGKNLVVFCK